MSDYGDSDDIFLTLSVEDLKLIETVENTALQTNNKSRTSLGTHQRLNLLHRALR